jgi:adenylate kinase family enzyme
MRIVIMGNSGSGKSTLARRLAGATDIPVLCLDAIAFEDGPQRKPIEESIAALMRFMDEHPQWIIEGCYGDLIEAALPGADELRFLNPGTEACVRHCLNRPWEPDKFASPEDQQAMLEPLLAWVREYDSRTDEFGLTRHRAIFAAFSGNKREYVSVDY